MSRVATGSKLVLILDVNQTYGANRGFEGFKKLLPNCKGNKFISFIELQHIQRSELTKLVDEIFK
jgi:predicted ribonuclease YlaK